MKHTHLFRLSITLVILALVATPLTVLTNAKTETGASSPATASASPPARQASDGNPIGSFKMHVQIQQRRVEVKNNEGSDASTQLVADFVSWDAQSRVATVTVAIKNVGANSLSGLLEGVVVKIASPQVIPLNADGATPAGSPTFDYNGVNLPSGATSAPREWQFKSPNAMDFQLDVEITLQPRTAIPAGTGATVFGPEGTSVTIQPGSVPYDVFVNIKSVPASTVTAPLGALEFVGAVEVDFEPVGTVGATVLVPPSAPLTLSIPAPSGLTTSKFIVGQQLLVDAIDQATPGLKQRLAATDTATLSGGQIVTEANIFPGVFGGGLYVFVANHGSGFATGVVSDKDGAQAGVVVSNSTNTLVSITGNGGKYTLYINGGPFVVKAFDPFTSFFGVGSGNIAVSGSTVQADITLNEVFDAKPMRDGIRNGGFERGDLSNWTTIGAVEVKQVLNSSAATIKPKEGKWMADVSTGTNAVGGVGSGLKQDFIVPAGVKTLTFDFNFISEEFPEFVGTEFDDTFRALITTDTKLINFAQVSINQAGSYTLIGDCGFPGGDTTCGQTGWRQASVDLSAYSGTNTPITVELLFSAIDAGDNIYDTHVLIDNIRFSTVWVDAKLVTGAQADLARVESEIRDANEILSQAGVNLQLRNATVIGGAANFLTPDVTGKSACQGCNFIPTDDELSLLSQSRSKTSTDVNIYYVRLMKENGLTSSAAGLTVGPDAYQILLSNSGIIFTDVFGGCTPGGHILAHELGHLLISPQKAEDPLEHKAGMMNFMGGTCSGPVNGILNRQQSEIINRMGAPFLSQ
ncbi:MAG: choice-of-anchor L domain-containing protein [Pyrinomonadaceae bacterium]|nr:choice-of-anchor L domain-containing protein [Pyrinomonadaceae bacterium]